MHRPSGEKVAPSHIPLLSPLSVSSYLPPIASHTFALPLSPLVRIRWPSGEKATYLTEPFFPVKVSSSAAGRIPHCGRRIRTAGGNSLAVRRKGHTSSFIRVSRVEAEQFRTTGRVQHPGPILGPNLAAGDNALAVRGKGHGLNPAAIPFPLDCERSLLFGCIPQLGRPIRTAGNNPPAIRRETPRTPPHYYSPRC